MFSLKTMKNFLNKNTKVRNFKFVKIDFPKNLNVQKDLQSY